MNKRYGITIALFLGVWFFSFGSLPSALADEKEKTAAAGTPTAAPVAVAGKVGKRKIKYGGLSIISAVPDTRAAAELQRLRMPGGGATGGGFSNGGTGIGGGAGRSGLVFGGTPAPEPVPQPGGATR